MRLTRHLVVRYRTSMLGGQSSPFTSDHYKPARARLHQDVLNGVSVLPSRAFK